MQGTVVPGGKSYLPALDGLRAISILAVIGFHGAWPGFSWGARGVDLFFVISGYLITSLLIREREKTGSVSLRDFYIRRSLRIFPAFYAFLAGYSLLCFFVYRDLLGDLPSTLLLSGLYVGNIAIAWFNCPVLVAHSWSLAMEEQFYLIYPALFRAAGRKILYVLAAVVLLVPIWRAVLFLVWGLGLPPLRFAYGPDTRADSLAWGCLLAVCLSSARLGGPLRNILRQWWVAPAGVALAIASVLISRNMALADTLAYTVLAIGCAAILGSTVEGRDGATKRVLASRPARLVGRLSYPLYLWHPAMLGIAERISNHVPPAFGTLTKQSSYVALSFGAAWMSYTIIEKPALRLKERFAHV